MSVVEKAISNFGNFHLEVQDWHLLDEGVIALWGPSGAGKSSLLRILLGLVPEAQLVWRWDREDLGQLSVRQRRLSVVFQNYCLFPHMTAQGNIMFPVSNPNNPSSIERFENLVMELSLSQIINKSVGQLSGGEQQRVALARALMGNPRMLFLDEPFSALDESLRESSRELVLRVIRRLKIPVLLVTHDREDVRTMANQVAILRDGKLWKQGHSLEDL